MHYAETFGRGPVQGSVLPARPTRAGVECSPLRYDPRGMTPRTATYENSVSVEEKNIAWLTAERT